jgi:hypothetical protein
MIMNARIILQPQQLCEMSDKAREDLEEVCMSAEQVRDVAEAWFKDKEKITYLESLLLRKERHHAT